MFNKLLSIAVPTYNMEALLDRCLESLILKDTDLRNLIEVFIVNDGSKDKSLEIARRYEAKFPEMFVVINKTNGNYGSCLNAALKAASGKYFKTLDADDYFDNKSFETFVRRLSDIECFPDLILTNGFLDTPNGKIKVWNSERSNQLVYGDLYLCEKKFPYNIQRVCFKTDIVKRISMSEKISYTDVEYLTYAVKYVKSYLLWMDLYVYNYVLGRDGQSVSMLSYSKNSDHIFKILYRYITEKYDSKSSVIELQNEAESLHSLINKYYQINILYKVTSKADYDNFIIIDHLIRDKCNYLEAKVYATTVHGIPYVKLWRNNSILFHFCKPTILFLGLIRNQLSKLKHL